MFGIFPRSAVGSRKIYLIVHYSFIAIMALLLGWFSDPIRGFIGYAQKMEHLSSVPWLEGCLCGVLFLLFYAIVRVVLLLLQLLGIEDESDFPDIESDWKEILSALEREGLPIDELPLFLVNGLTPDQEKSAFESASNITWRVNGAPYNRPSASIHAFANDDAIYLSCTNIGTTNIQQGKVAEISDVSAVSGMFQPSAAVTGTRKAEGVPRQAPAPPRSVTGTNPSGPALMPPSAAPASSSPASPSPGRGFGAIFGTMAPGGLKRAMETVTAINRGAQKGYGKKRVEPLTSMDLQIGVRRMQFLCGLIAKARHPFCQINGMLQAYPFSWASDTEYSRKLAPAIREDLQVVHNTFQLQFPVVAVVTEVDDVSGIKDFMLRVERMQPGIRLSRAGSSYAAGAEVTDKNAEWIVDRGMEWFRGWIYTAFATDLDNRDNQKLFQMMCEISQRRKELASLLNSTMYKVVQPGVRLHGVYFSATGRAATEQGFVRGVLDKVLESPGMVAWTPELLRQKRRAGILSWLYIVGSITMITASIAIYVLKLKE